MTVRNVLTLIVGFLVVLLSGLSLVTAVRTDEWWVRLFDFPRFQLSFVLLLTGLAVLAARPKGGWLYATLGLWAVASVYNGYKLAPYGGFWPTHFGSGANCPEGSSVRILVANVKRGNEQSAPLRDLLRSINPDVFLAMETDAWWDRQLDAVAQDFSSHLKEVAAAQNHFGIHLMSKLPRLSGEILYLEAQAVPSVRATFQLAGGETFEFLGLHPKPPTLFQDSTLRDVQLMAGARLAAASSRPTVVAGDFNATPWERTFARMVAEAQLTDPRVGRGLFNTYQIPVLGAVWPLDHILIQQPLRVSSFTRGPDIGSDHLPIIAELCPTALG